VGDPRDLCVWGSPTYSSACGVAPHAAICTLLSCMSTKETWGRLAIYAFVQYSLAHLGRRRVDLFNILFHLFPDRKVCWAHWLQLHWTLQSPEKKAVHTPTPLLSPTLTREYAPDTPTPAHTFPHGVHSLSPVPFRSPRQPYDAVADAANARIGSSGARDSKRHHD
jgi:hypothetical protein